MQVVINSSMINDKSCKNFFAEIESVSFLKLSVNQMIDSKRKMMGRAISSSRQATIPQFVSTSTLSIFASVDVIIATDDSSACVTS